ncbi:hypothetical protein GCM10022226_43480 [Sphaerisporangium flaviroseum]|uniref:Uncharacterized protein n=1 Tax=Sphaerisporangium flaviroseum TaxID=509199 RepID=A0ABP7IH10_9ACTN
MLVKGPDVQPRYAYGDMKLATTPVPGELWDELDRLAPPAGGWLE